MKKSTKSILIAVCIILIAAVVFFILTAEKKLAEDIPEEAGTAQHAEPTSNVSRQVREIVREKTGSAETLDEVINILLIGVDNDYLAGMNDLGNADGVMLLTVNNKTEEIILTSFLRDTRVRVPNAYDTKLTTTYHKGGVPLLREVFELNFEINAYIYSSDIACKQKKQFEKDILKSNQLTLEMYKGRNNKTKIKEGLSKLFSSIL